MYWEVARAELILSPSVSRPVRERKITRSEKEKESL